MEFWPFLSWNLLKEFPIVASEKSTQTFDTTRILHLKFGWRMRVNPLSRHSASRTRRKWHFLGKEHKSDESREFFVSPRWQKEAVGRNKRGRNEATSCLGVSRKLEKRADASWFGFVSLGGDSARSTFFKSRFSIVFFFNWMTLYRIFKNLNLEKYCQIIVKWVISRKIRIQDGN